MKVIYHRDFARTYASDPAAAPGRLAPSVARLERLHEFVAPVAANEREARLVHGPGYLEGLRRRKKLHGMALLAAGGAIEAARLAARGEPAFALIRPPGHHAGPNDAWGFCFLNNVAIAVEVLLRDGLARSAAILDIDLHHGDGTEDAFRGRPEVSYLHPEAGDRRSWLTACRAAVAGLGPVDVVAVSAGFDRHLDDWGGMLETEDYRTVGAWVREAAADRCAGRRFGVLEGGYDPLAMAGAVEALLDGMGRAPRESGRPPG